MEHLHRAMRAKSNTDKYHEYHALCVACLSYIDDEDLKQEIQKDLSRPDTNLSNDFIRNYKAEMKSGVPNYLILENEYSRLVPRIVMVWLKVQRALIDQDLIPWTLTYPEKVLEGSLIDEVLTDIQMQKFKRATPIREAERAAMGVPGTTPQLMDNIPTHSYFDDDDSPMTIGSEKPGKEFEQEATENIRDEEEAVSELEKQLEEVEAEPDSVPEEIAEENETNPPQAGERIAEPELDRISPLDAEPPLPDPTDEEIPEYSDEEIERGAEAMKRLLREKMEAKNARQLRHPRED
jgi:hypothetical protein